MQNVVPTVDNVTNLAVNEGSAFTLVGLNASGGSRFRQPAQPTAWRRAAGNVCNPFDQLGRRLADGHQLRVDRKSRFGRARRADNGSVCHDPHTFADDGVYTVTIRVADDDMGAFADPARFVTGVAGVDFVDLTFTIRVDNVAPTLTSVTPVGDDDQRIGGHQLFGPVQ